MLSMLALSKLWFTPWYSWNTAKVGFKHQSINQALSKFDYNWYLILECLHIYYALTCIWICMAWFFFFSNFRIIFFYNSKGGIILSVECRPKTTILQWNNVFGTLLMFIIWFLLIREAKTKRATMEYKTIHSD
jgi:hypothetical protein